MSDIECSVDGCPDPKVKRGWCSKHYQRWRKHGDTTVTRQDLALQRSQERFWSNVNKTGSCWLWTGLVNDAGYGLFSVLRVQHRAHRWIWELENSPIPDGMQVDHLCRTRRCVRLDHLRLATNKQNAENKDATSTSGYRGVSFSKRRNKWIAQVGHNGRNHYGGYYETPHEAAEAARSLRNRLFTHNILDRGPV